MSSQGSAASTASPLALPAPSDVAEPEAEKITVNETQTFKFDKLGPVVVNKDGTLSRIANWEEMTAIEKKRTLRVLVARNQVRLANHASEAPAGGEVVNMDGIGCVTQQTEQGSLGCVGAGGRVE